MVVLGLSLRRPSHHNRKPTFLVNRLSTVDIGKGCLALDWGSDLYRDMAFILMCVIRRIDP